jgi:hypothetical protein
LLKLKFLQNYSGCPIFPVTTLTSPLSASVGLLLGLLLDPEDGGDTLLPIVGLFELIFD